MGQNLISLKGASWRGKSCLNTSDRGMKTFLKMENVYVSSDGGELRHFPGFSCILDLSDENNGLGYGQYFPEAVRPIFQTSPAETYQYYYTGIDTRVQTQFSRAKMMHLHWFEQVGDTLLIGGESRFRETLVYVNKTGGGVIATIAVGAVGGRWTFTLTDNPAANSATDATGPGLNGLTVNNILYIEGWTVANATLQAAMDANLNGRTHEIKTISANTVTLHTTTAVGIGLTSLTNTETGTRYINRVSNNRVNDYSTPNATQVWGFPLDYRPNDPPQLTSWRVIDSLSRTDTDKACHPAWVANRHRDFGDALQAGDVEGVWQNSGGTRGVSRRENRRLPYRMNPDCATDRVIVAAPGYGCMFQVPLKIPTQPTFTYPAPSPGGDEDGLLSHSNSVYDKPRSLGIPKGRLVDSLYTPAQPSPGNQGLDSVNFNISAMDGSPGLGLASGDYAMSIAYEDEALGEEGLASEPVFLTIPSNTYAYTINVTYIHPGYILPECMATKVNVYLSGPGQEAMAYYASFPLAEIGSVQPTVNDSSYSNSAIFGFEPCSPSHPAGIHRVIRLPMLGDGSATDESLDAERLAPQSASMPRGAEACRYVRGVLVAGGAMGNIGPSLQLSLGKATMAFDSAGTSINKGEMQIRVHGNTLSVPAGPNMDGDAQTSTLGIAGRAFPDAYQGIEAVTKELWPVGSINQRIDRVVNRMTSVLAPNGLGATQVPLHYERVRLVREVFDRTRTAGAEPTALTTSVVNKDIWYVMPKGQVQLCDPGAPWRSNKAAIQITDPKRGDDIVAIGDLAGNAIVCSRKETYSFSWYRNAGSETPNLITNEHGCVSANSMVEFDGGLAWLSERGPMAMGGNLQFIGKDVQEDFYGPQKRYLHDSRGMMRHAWGCHDPSRGIVLWGLVTNEDLELDYASETVYLDSYTWNELDDGGKSRMPCDEVLVWNYRSNAFSTWRPPSGLEVYWMRTLRDEDGEVRLCFLARDGRIYAFDDAANDSAMTTTYAIEGDVVARQLTASTTLAFTISGGTGVNGTVATGHNGDRRHLREGMLVEILNVDGEMVGETAIDSITSVSSTGATIELAAAMTWKDGYKVRIGARQRATIISSYYGAEALDNLSTQAVQMRYSLHGKGSANVKVIVHKTEMDDTDTTPRTVAMSPADAWPSLGQAAVGTDSLLRIARRRRFAQGGADATEIAVEIQITGSAQTRIEDISLEVA